MEKFRSLPPTAQLSAWDGLWQRDITPWDRAGAHPALQDLLQTRSDLLPRVPQHADRHERPRALVPGCGRGFDARLLATHGFDVLGVDISATAVAAAERVVESDGDVQKRQGRVRFEVGDFFGRISVDGNDGREWDLVYDYTFLCALPVELRPRWAARMSELLGTEGRMVCMEFPLGKDPKTGGPPHGLTHELYVELLRRPGDEVRYDDRGMVVPQPERGESESALVCVESWVPQRGFESQLGQTMVSVWRHRGESNVESSKA